MDLDSDSTSKSIVDIQKLTRGFLSRKHSKLDDSYSNISAHITSKPELIPCYDPETIEEDIEIPFGQSSSNLKVKQSSDKYFKLTVTPSETYFPKKSESVLEYDFLVKDCTESNPSLRSNEEPVPFFSADLEATEKNAQPHKLNRIDLGKSMVQLGKTNINKSSSMNAISLGKQLINRIKLEDKAPANISTTENALTQSFKDFVSKVPEKPNLRASLEPIPRPPHRTYSYSKTPIQLRKSFFNPALNPSFVEGKLEKFAPYHPSSHYKEMQIFNVPTGKKKLKPLRRKPNN